MNELVYEWNGKKYIKGGRNNNAYKYLVFDVIKDYLSKNINSTIEDIKDIFNKEEFDTPPIRVQSEYNEHINNRSDDNKEGARKRLFEPVKFKNENLYISNQWSSDNSNNSIPYFIETVREFGYKISVTNVSIKNNYWIISSNPDRYDSINAFKNLSEVDWGNVSNNHINIGDIVYIYVASPLQKIAIKTIVTKSNFGESELLGNDEKFINLNELRPCKNFIRLKLVKFINNNMLTIDKLHENGINGNIQGKRTVDGAALAFILKNEDDESLNSQDKKSVKNNHAFFENGVYESVLKEIIEAQNKEPNITCYIQPHSTGTIVFLKNTQPSKNNPITFYISTTANLGSVSYTAEIIGWEDKRDLLVSDRGRVEKLNKHIKEYQKGETDIYKYADDDKTKECVNLISIRNLKKLSIPFSVSMLNKVKDGTPLASTRTQAGGWSEVYKLNIIENPTFIEDVTEEFEKKITASKYMSRGREERLEKANKQPEEIQVISRAFKRNADVVVSVLERASGICEKCEKEAPFIRKKDNTPYLEVHHKIQLADGGEDSVKNAIAVCPNCHRELHFGY